MKQTKRPEPEYLGSEHYRVIDNHGNGCILRSIEFGDRLLTVGVLRAALELYPDDKPIAISNRGSCIVGGFNCEVAIAEIGDCGDTLIIKPVKEK